MIRRKDYVLTSTVFDLGHTIMLPPELAQQDGLRTTTRSRGRCPGNGLRVGRRLVHVVQALGQVLGDAAGECADRFPTPRMLKAGLQTIALLLEHLPAKRAPDRVQRHAQQAQFSARDPARMPRRQSRAASPRHRLSGWSRTPSP